MRYVGIHFGHDSSLVIINESGAIEFYAQAERYERKKNWGGYNYQLKKPGISCLVKYFPDLGQLRDDDFCVFVSIGGKVTQEKLWQEVGNVSEQDSPYDPFLVRPFKAAKEKNFMYWTLGRNPDMMINHHLAHILSAWCFRPNDNNRFFMAYDGVGLDALGIPHSSLVGEISSDGFKKYNDAYNIPTSCCLTSLLGYNSAGKAMGLAGYVNPNHKINKEKFLRRTVELSMNPTTHTPQYYEIPDFKKGITKNDMQYVSQFYKWYTNEIIWTPIEQNINKFSCDRGVVIGGGTTLALELNTKIHERVKDVVFGPPTDDSGLALGAAAFAFFHHKGIWPKVDTASLCTLQKPLPNIGPQDPAEIAERIARGSIVGLLRGQAEAGPRALGFRSILASAKNKNNLRRVSQQIKKREFYRPLAPIVTEEQFDRFFIGPKGRHMQYRVFCNEEAKERLPAIVHKDGTARPQVVSKRDDPWLHELLVAYGEKSGVQCLINTSLNKKGKPICNTYEDAAEEMNLRHLELVSIALEKRQKYFFV